MIKPLRTIWAGFVLVAGVMLAAAFTSLFMTVIAFPWGAFLAVHGSRYWHDVWIGFDKFMNAVIGGSHKETISSRLGKSTIHGLKPVFGFRLADNLVSWWLHQIDNNHAAKSIDWSVGEDKPQK